MTESDTHTVTWKRIPGFGFYEASDHGQIRSIDRTVGGRQLRGVVLKGRVSNSGYLLVNLTDDAGMKQTRTIHTLVLLAHVGPPPPGHETLHGAGGPLDNRWPQNIRYGSKKENSADAAAAGTLKVPPPAFDCINHERCGGKAGHPRRRCVKCAEEVGREAAKMIENGVNLAKVAARFGYQNDAWVHSLAVKYGGCQVPASRAREQGMPWSHRVKATLRYWQALK